MDNNKHSLLNDINSMLVMQSMTIQLSPYIHILQLIGMHTKNKLKVHYIKLLEQLSILLLKIRHWSIEPCMHCYEFLSNKSKFT